MGEVSNSQCHKVSTLAGTHNPRHRSQPAKELAFCSAWVTVFRWTQLKYKSLITNRQKGERTTLIRVEEMPHKEAPLLVTQ